MQRELAKLKGFDFMVEDHGLPVLSGTFHYDNGGAQGLGYIVDVAFLMRFLGVFNVDCLQLVNGKSCWVMIEDGLVVGIEPLHKKEGKPFYMSEWREWRKSQSNPSAHEMLTGTKS